MKNTLNEIKSLMKRMEETPNGGSNYILNEVSCKWREVIGEESFYDLLSGLKQGNIVTFGYVQNAKIEVPKGKRLNPTTNRMNQFDDYETLGKNLGEEGVCRNVIKVLMYNMPWQTEEDINTKYQNWKKTRDELGSKYGVEFGKARYGISKNNFNEKGGISQYDGNNSELSTHTYTNLNMHGIKPISTQYYLVMDDGHIKPIDVSKLTLLQGKPSISAIEKLRNAGASEEEISPLLNMQYQRFEHSKILFISATPDSGIPTLLINNKLSNTIVGETGANPKDIINIAKERYCKFMNDDVNFVDD